MRARSILTGSLPELDVTLYTVPKNTTTKWVLAYLNNTTVNTVTTVNLGLIQASTGTSLNIIFGKSLASGDAIRLGSGDYVILEAGDVIRGRASSVGVSCVLTLEESTSIVRVV
jgi:hypothetical protein